MVDDIVTEFVAVMKRIGALTHKDSDEFLDMLDATNSDADEEYTEGMDAIAIYFSESE